MKYEYIRPGYDYNPRQVSPDSMMLFIIINVRLF